MLPLKALNLYSREELLALPLRKVDEERQYDSLLLLSTGKKHDCGWAMIAIIGIIKGFPEEIICSHCDDIEWQLPPMEILNNGQSRFGQFHTDCALLSGAFHVWRSGARFRVNSTHSRATIELLPLEILHFPKIVP